MENLWSVKTELFVTFQCYRNEIKWTHWLSFAYPLARSLVWSLFLEKERKRLLGYRFSFGTIQRRLPWPLRKDDTQIRVRSKLFQGGAVASWLVRSSPDRAGRVRVLAGDIVLRSWAILSWCPSPPRCIQLFCKRLSYKSVWAYATMSKGIVGNDG